MALDYGTNANQWYSTFDTLGGWNWGAGDGTAMSWFWVDADHDGVEFPCMLSKSTNAPLHGRFNLGFGDNSDMSIKIGGAADLEAQSNSNPVSIGKWNFGVGVWDTGGVNGDQKLYYGDLSTRVAEVGGYAVQTVGAGPYHNTAATTLLSGINRTAGINGEFDGKIALIAAWDVILTLDQIELQQYNLAFPIDKANCKIFVNSGWYGTGTQVDWSGNGSNGTVVGAATLSPHVPLQYERMNDYWDVPYLVAVAPPAGAPMTTWGGTWGIPT